jgi:uncharacterized protein (TIGR02452 family)
MHSLSLRVHGKGETERMSLSRSKAALHAGQTARLLEEGFYLNSRGQRVELASQIEDAVRNTRHFREGMAPEVRFEPRPMRIEVSNETTFFAAKRLEESGLKTLALNFASAKNPGGGWKNGARAQEECLCRGSALSECLYANFEFYEFHRERGGGLYSDWMMLSLGVPVFRGDEPEELLLDSAWTTSFLTAAAPNFKAVSLEQRGQIAAVFAARIEKVLAIGVANGFDAVVLGAWGCGAFGNDPNSIAPLFAQALSGPFQGAFTNVAFAVLDHSDDEAMVEPFRRAFELR